MRESESMRTTEQKQLGVKDLKPKQLAQLLVAIDWSTSGYNSEEDRQWAREKVYYGEPQLDVRQVFD